MDIVNRLKFFMESQQIANSQFADTCRIPRPTLSQLLNGRNKKISDELIGKIHDAFPKLSVLWLMFGEGRMMVDENIEISEPQKDENSEVPAEKYIDFQENVFDINRDKNAFEIEPNNFSQTKTATNATRHNEFAGNDSIMAQPTHTKNTEVSIKTDCNKKITNIVVFYSDNSFQSFTPSD